MDEKIKRLMTLREESLYEMANVSREDTNLPYDIWIDSKGKERNVPHSTPRVKVEVDGELIPVSISDNPQILVDKKIIRFSRVARWIIKYKEVLISHWNKEISDRTALNRLND